MASARTLKLQPAHQPVYAASKLTQVSADKTSELLTQDFENHHIFFNDKGFHNHIVHGLLSLYAAGATPEQLQKHYVANSAYQRPHMKSEPIALQELHDPAKFNQHLGDEKYYRDFVAYYQQQIEAKGWQQAFKDEFLKSDERSDDLLARLYAGLLHPIIHMGFGIEFEQPLIMAEAFGEACVHKPLQAPLYQGSEEAARRRPRKGRAILDIIEEGCANPKVKDAVTWDDANKVVDLMGRSEEDLVELCGSYQVQPEELNARLAEMVNFNTYMTAASQRPPHRVKFDFFLIHSHNCAIFFQSFINASWLSSEAKVRLLEWKVRMDIANYFGRGAPKFSIEEIVDYKPKVEGDWATIFRRCNDMPEDDGHAVKYLRAVKAAEELCAKYSSSGAIKGADMWLKIGHMAIDSVEDNEPKWVFNCGFEEAWTEIGKRSVL